MIWTRSTSRPHRPLLSGYDDPTTLTYQTVLFEPISADVRHWLVTEQRKSRKERRTAMQMHADLVKVGLRDRKRVLCAVVTVSEGRVRGCPARVEYR